MNRTKIMIIGGHGEVGSMIVAALRNHDLVLAGRNHHAMSTFCERLELTASIRVMDINHFNASLLEDIRFLIVCVDQKDTRLLAYCIEHGIDYMDVSANATFITNARKLPIHSKSKVLLGVGIAPGVSNVLAETLLDSNPVPSSLNLDIHLGLGDHHGVAAIHWTLNSMVERYQDPQGNWLKAFYHRNPLSDSKQLIPPTYNFNFADQHILKLKYPNITFQTYLGFDQGWASRLFNGLARTNVLQLLRFPLVQKVTTGFLNKKWLGDDSFRISAQSSQQSLSIQGRRQGEATGAIAALCAQLMLTESNKHGHLDMIDFISYETLKNLPFLTVSHTEFEHLS